MINARLKIREILQLGRRSVAVTAAGFETKKEREKQRWIRLVTKISSKESNRLQFLFDVILADKQLP